MYARVEQFCFKSDFRVSCLIEFSRFAVNGFCFTLLLSYMGGMVGTSATHCQMANRIITVKTGKCMKLLQIFVCCEFDRSSC